MDHFQTACICCKIIYLPISAILLITPFFLNIRLRSGQCKHKPTSQQKTGYDTWHKTNIEVCHIKESWKGFRSGLIKIRRLRWKPGEWEGWVGLQLILIYLIIYGDVFKGLWSDDPACKTLRYSAYINMKSNKASWLSNWNQWMFGNWNSCSIMESACY